MRHLKSFAMAILALPAANAAAAPVVVTAHPDQVVEPVSFADLNLSTKSGVRTLKGRIRGAADRVCYGNSPDPLEASLEDHACSRAAIRDGYAQLDRVLAARGQPPIAAMTIMVSAHR